MGGSRRAEWTRASSQIQRPGLVSCTWVPGPTRHGTALVDALGLGFPSSGMPGGSTPPLQFCPGGIKVLEILRLGDLGSFLL
jgi:hypothetical protein